MDVIHDKFDKADKIINTSPTENCQTMHFNTNNNNNYNLYNTTTENENFNINNENILHTDLNKNVETNLILIDDDKLAFNEEIRKVIKEGNEKRISDYDKRRNYINGKIMDILNSNE